MITDGVMSFSAVYLFFCCKNDFFDFFGYLWYININ